jgi:UDP-N-acetylglucosamine--N-acetylmuramyl-(pentapeptide) pyrophosphoryl-undecaprenol N-acetylglucosamine transferase
MKFLIVAAKTGGHVYPASSIAKELISNDHEIIFLGTDSVIEKKAYADICSKSYNLSIQGFRGQNFIKKLYVLFQVLVSIFKVIKIISKEKIDGMIGFGGFITVPAGIGCWLKRKPVFLHEQNAVLGSANKLITIFSKINFLGFPIEGIKRSVISGNPIRRSFVNNPDELNNNNNSINIYITGGSQGAEYINKKVPKIFQDFPYPIEIKHQCGKNNLEKVKNLYLHQNIVAEVFEFYDNPAEQILWSDFVISRGGALSLSEITSLKRGVIVIPLPTSIDNHQVENAKIIEQMQMGIIHDQKDSLDILLSKIYKIIENKAFLDWKKNVDQSHSKSSEIIISHIEKYFKNETL